MASSHHPSHEAVMDISVTSSFGSPIMFNPKRGIEASAGVLKDIILGSTNDPNNESFADFEDLDHIRPNFRSMSDLRTSSGPTRKVGQVPTRRYSPPQGSTGSGGTKSPSWETPLCTSSPMMHRRQMRAPYYVADTMEAAGGYYLEDPHHPASWHPQIPTHAYRSHHHLSMIGQPRHHFELMPQGLYDESAYRLLPAECWSPAGARLMTDEELQREYAVVLDALSCSLCSVGSIPAQMPTESSREQSCSGIQPPFYQNFHHQSSPAAQQTQHQTFCSGVVQAPGPYNHQLTVSESCVDEDEEDMSSWHGISGVPGLGYSIPPGEYLIEDIPHHHQPKKDTWSAQSAQHLAKLKVDLPRVSHHHTSTVPTTVPNEQPLKKSSVQNPRGYNGVSAVNHLLSENFERHNPKKSKKPLRATVSSRLKSKLSLSSDLEGDLNGPRSLPSQFIPRAPIPPPAVLAKKKSSDRERNRINNEAILAKDNQLYQSPKERDGDYSYAYDCSISPAVVIKWTEDSEEEDSEAEISKPNTKVKSNNQENIYEEIQDLSLHQLNSDGSASSSVNNSDSGIGHGDGGAGPSIGSSASGSKGSSSSSSAGSKGTLDVSSKQNRHKNKQKLSSLDTLISQTSPNLTPHQRLNLRKSLVDELFEELIQRHHKRVLDELKLDVEEFIAPTPNEHQIISTPKSTRSSSNSTRLTRCESMDFKEQQKEPKKEPLRAKLMQSARKCSEKLFTKKSVKNSKQSVTSAQQLHVDRPQVTRRGHRPLSTLLSSNGPKMDKNNVIEDSDDSDSEQERKLLRSQIIKSFWEQHDQDEQFEQEDDHKGSKIETIAR